MVAGITIFLVLFVILVVTGLRIGYIPQNYELENTKVSKEEPMDSSTAMLLNKVLRLLAIELSSWAIEGKTSGKLRVNRHVEPRPPHTRGSIEFVDTSNHEKVTFDLVLGNRTLRVESNRLILYTGTNEKIPLKVPQRKLDSLLSNIGDVWDVKSKVLEQQIKDRINNEILKTINSISLEE